MGFICPECHSDYTTNIGCGMISCEDCGSNFSSPYCDDYEDEDEDEDDYEDDYDEILSDIDYYDE